MKESMTRVRFMARNLASLYAVQILNLAIPALSLPFVIRALGIELFGELAIALAVSMTIVMIVDAALPTIAFQFISGRTKFELLKNSPPNSVNRIFYATQQIRVVLSGALFVIFISIVYWVPINEQLKTLLVLGFFNVIGTLSLPAYYFTAQQEAHLLALFHLIGRLTSCIGLIAFVTTPNDLYLAMTITSCGTLISGMTAHYWLLTKKRIHFAKYLTVSKRINGWLLQKGKNLYPSQIVQAFLVNAPVVLLGFFSGKLEAGLFNSAEKLARLGVAVFEPVNTALAPSITRRAKESLHKTNAFLQKSIALTTVVCIFSDAIVMALSPQILVVLTSKSSPEHILVLQVFCVWACIFVINRHFETLHFLALGNTVGHRQVASLYLPIYIGCLVVGTQHGAANAVVAMIFAELVALSLYGIARFRRKAAV
jgi:polysaccharide transporter, PST family